MFFQSTKCDKGGTNRKGTKILDGHQNETEMAKRRYVFKIFIIKTFHLNQLVKKTKHPSCCMWVDCVDQAQKQVGGPDTL